MTNSAAYELARSDEDSSLCGYSDDDERTTPLLHDHRESNGTLKKNGLVKIDLSNADVMPSVAERFPKEPQKAIVSVFCRLYYTSPLPIV